MTETPALSRVPGVELARTGQWSASTGVSTITRNDLANAVSAMDCPAVRDPVIKLGHIDPRFDGEPAFGRITNLSVRNACSLVGDLTGMPGWLGPILASAYPSRSIEGQWDFRCSVGHVHPFVITGLALLGITEPAIGSLAPLEDIAAMWTADYQPAPPAGAQMKGAAMPKNIAAAATVEDIRRAYYDREQNYDLWIEEIQLAPLQLIVVNDADGTRARIAVGVDPEQDGDAAIRFGDPVPVIVRYDDVAAPTADPADGQQVAASKLRFASRTESRPEPRATQEGGSMGKQISAADGSGDATSGGGGITDDQKAKLREVLGLTDDADEATFTAALEALVKKAKVDAVDPEPTAGPAPAAEPTADPASAPTEEAPEKKVAAGRNEMGVPKTVTVDAEQWDQVQQFMASARKREETEQVERADAMVDAAFRVGKIGRNAVAAYKGLARKDYEGTKGALDTLAASSAFPVGEIGHSVDVGETPDNVRDDAAYQDWKF